MDWLRTLFARVRMLLGRREEERALQEEVRFHLEMEAGKLESQGWDHRPARREAYRRFGGVDRVSEEVRDERGGRWLEDAVADVRFGWRGLKRNPAFTFAAVATLALGIGSTTAAFSLFDGILLRPLPYALPDRLVEVRELGSTRRFYPSFPNFADWREQSDAFSGLVAIQGSGVQPLLGLSEPMRVPFMGVSRGFLRTLGVRPFLGRDIADSENVAGGAPVALVSHRLWAGALGGPARLDGVTVEAYGRSYEVVGVLPPGFRFLYDADFVFPAEQFPGTVRSAHAYRVVGRLADGVSLAAARTSMNALSARLKAAYGAATQAESAELRPLAEVVTGSQRQPLSMLLAAAALVLLVGCANVASTLLAQGTVRAREMAVRTSLGARRSRLVRQLLAESALLTASGAVAGAALAWLAVRGAVLLGPGVLPRLDQVTVDGPILGFAMAVSVSTLLVFGLFPALRLTGQSLSEQLRGGRGETGRRGMAWNLIVGAEAAFAVLLLVGALLLVRSVRQVLTHDAGWDHRGVLEMSVTLPNGAIETEAEGVALLRRLHDELAALPGVEVVGMGNFDPLSAGNYTAPAHDPDQPDSPENYTGWRVVDAQYFEALRVPVLNGRLFEPGDGDVAVINRSLAELLWPGESPIGHTVISNFDYRSAPLRIVGVVTDARDWRWSRPQPELFVPWWSRPEHAASMAVLIRTDNDPSTLIGPARERLRALDPRIPAEFSLLSSALNDSMADRRFMAAVLGSFAACGLLLAMIGIFGVVSWTVASRRREIGIRIAMGAAHWRIRTRVHGSVLPAVAVGILVGMLAAVGLTRFLRDLLFEVEPLDPLSFLVAPLLFLLTALLAGDAPARRSARTHPVSILRED